MAFDEKLAGRIRLVLQTRKDVAEKLMFGGIAFMVRGHMCCGVTRSSLMVRVDPALAARWLREPHVRPMDFTGRPMKGFLFVDAAGVASLPALRKWIGRATEFVDRRPAQPSAPRRKSAARTTN